jgi:hypothetical protein
MKKKGLARTFVHTRYEVQVATYPCLSFQSDKEIFAQLPISSNFPSRHYFQFLIQHSAIKMPQNEYIERWQKQYGKRCVFNLLNVSFNF